jgi:hypothetical protein
VPQVFIIGYVIDLFVMKHHHVGYPMTLLTPDDMIAMIKVSNGGTGDLA